MSHELTETKLLATLIEGDMVATEVKYHIPYHNFVTGTVIILTRTAPEADKK